MKTLNQDIIIQRIKSDANIIESFCSFDVQEDLLKALKNERIADVKSQQPLLQKIILPLAGVAALALIVANIKLPSVTNNLDIQTPLLKDKSTQVVKVDNGSVKIDHQLEKNAMKEDILYLSQIFSM